MTANPDPVLRWLVRGGAAVFLLAAAGGTSTRAQTAAYPPTIPPQQARIWFYRDYAPNSTQARPYLRLNGAAVAISEPYGSLYRDVPPGHYQIAVDSYGVDFNQTSDVDLLPGQQAFAKVVSNDNWVDFGGSGRSGSYHRDTFYVWTYPPEIAYPEIARTRFFGGGEAFRVQ